MSTALCPGIPPGRPGRCGIIAGSGKYPKRIEDCGRRRNKNLSISVLVLTLGFGDTRCLGLGTVGGIRGCSRRPSSFVSPLSGIEMPDSGCTADFTSDGQEPLNRGLAH